MRVDTAEVETLMREVCRRRSVPAEQVGDVVSHFLLGELEGRPTHGVTKFCFESRFFPERQGDPRVVHRSGCAAVVDARRSIGPVAALHAVGLCTELAAEHGVGLVGTLNSQRYGVLSDWSSRLAGAGMLGIAANTSRADCLPAGARRPVLGVNAVSWSVPTPDGPYTVDLATSVAPMGNLWDARRGDATLHPGAFVDAAGDVTDDPDLAQAALIFGGHKGLGVSLLVQVLTGTLFGFPAGDGVRDTWTTGYCLLAVRPPGGGARFGDENATFLAGVADGLAHAADDDAVRLPGTRSRMLRETARRTGTIDLPRSVLDRLRRMARGVPEPAGVSP